MAELKPLDGYDKIIYIWKFLPSLPASVVALVLFTVVTLALAWRLFRTRTWFCIAFVVGGLLQVLGYGIRIFCHYYTNLLAPYVVQLSFIVLAPVFYAATVYMTLTRLVLAVRGERFSPVPTKWMTWIFLSGDFLSLMLQGNAVGLTTKEETKTIGEIIVITGLVVQLITCGYFVYVAVVFHMRLQRDGRKETERMAGVPWRQVLMMLYACSVLIAVRSVFRVVEYAMGTDGYLLSNEWFLYGLDAVPMWFTQVIFLIWYPDNLEAGLLGSEDGHVLMGMNRLSV